MTRDAFPRLALIACCCALVAGLAAVGVFVSWTVATAAAVLGPVLAAGVAAETRDEPTADTILRRRRREPTDDE